MNTKLISYLFVLICIGSACKKKDSKNTVATIDVSKQWYYDPSGLLISSAGDDQWQMKTFTAEEINLFNSLDTTNLNGTTTNNATLSNNTLYPNPFTSVYAFAIKLVPAFSGQIILKSVIVDSLLSTQFKSATRINITNGNAIIQFSPNLSVGRYRLYYTLSSQSNPNFYKSWGNIQRNQ